MRKSPKVMPCRSISVGANRKVIIGVCGMARKVNSKPMRAIIAKMLELYDQWLEFVVFPEDIILNQPIDKWPLCDCLISFYATNFPLDKAIAYADLRKPYIINDLRAQYDLLCRRKIYEKLQSKNIDTPRHVIYDQSDPNSVLVEHPDSIEVNGQTINKSFVEKPISAEDHNIHIYYPTSVGGGSQRLFRKIKNRSSEYSKDSFIRRDGSYVYEEFVAAEGIDIKVYAVGPFYAHAEARKSPALDGKVERDHSGKEIRYPVILTAREKEIAHAIVVLFGQTVCGFDLLRAGGKSYVCDVNGFSFVKTSTKYYEDSARILGNQILCRLAPVLHIPWSRPFQPNDPPLTATTSGKLMELRCVLAVIRHGDRTPKQKIKMGVTDKRFFELFEREGGYKKSSQAIKMKKPKQLVSVLELVRSILSELMQQRKELTFQVDRSIAVKFMQFDSESLDDSTILCTTPSSTCSTPTTIPVVRHSHNSSPAEKELYRITQLMNKYDQVRQVLEMYGHFSGINRKVQLKSMQRYGSRLLAFHKNKKTDDSDSEDDVIDVSDYSNQPALLLIVKWGGELTTAGVMQAEALGKLFRTLYPGIRGGSRDEDKRGLGFLRLHSTYRHDLKIYASEEGRVQMTAAAFTRGMLALEGELPPILVQMVKSANTDGLLDDDNNASQYRAELKTALHQWLQVDKDLTQDEIKQLNPLGRKSINDALEFIKNPRKMCDEINGYVHMLYETIRRHKLGLEKSISALYQNESWELAERRWGKLLHDFRRHGSVGVEDNIYDISKIPDIYDNVKYDMEHNPELCLNHEEQFERMYLCVKNVADVLVPSEYGIKKDGKMTIAQGVCSPLLKKLQVDLRRCVEDDDENVTRLDPRATEGIATPNRHVRTRLYFTSESHIHTLMNIIQYGGLYFDTNDRKWQRAMNYLSSVTEFNYMTQLVMMLYEDTSAEGKKLPRNKRFHLELVFSPGLYPCFQTEKERIYETGVGQSSHSCQGVTLSLSHSISGAPRTLSSEAETMSDQLVERSSSATVQTVGASHTPLTSVDENETLHLDANGHPVMSTRDDVPHVRLTRLDDVRRQQEFTSEEIANASQPDSPNVPGELSHEENSSSHLARCDTVTCKLNIAGESVPLKIDIDSPGTIVSNLSSSSILGNVNEQLEQQQRRRTLSAPGTHYVVKSHSTNEMPVFENAKSSVSAIALAANHNLYNSSSAKTSPTNIPTQSTNQRNKTTKNSESQASINEIELSSSLPNNSSLSPYERANENTIDGGKELSGSLSDDDVSPISRQKSMSICQSTTPEQTRKIVPYRFKHHTLNLLRDADNKLISTAVISGMTTAENDLNKTWHASTKEPRGRLVHVPSPAVLSTAVIGRSSSAPKLQMVVAGEDIKPNEIRRFWPPLRSLETLHDHITFSVFDEYLTRVTTVRTPVPSPPKTPRDISRENSDLNSTDPPTYTNHVVHGAFKELRKISERDNM